MARQCELCGRGVASGNQISHSHRKTRRRFSPNLQRVRAKIDGTVRRIVICTRCLRSGHVVRA